MTLRPYFTESNWLRVKPDKWRRSDLSLALHQIKHIQDGARGILNSHNPVINFSNTGALDIGEATYQVFRKPAGVGVQILIENFSARYLVFPAGR